MGTPASGRDVASAPCAARSAPGAERSRTFIGKALRQFTTDDRLALGKKRGRAWDRLLPCRPMRVGRAQRARALSCSVAAVASFVAVCAWAAWACLPDLEIAPATQPSFCGDGVINPDAGEQCDPGPDASPMALLACPLTPMPGCQVGSCQSDGGTLPFSDPVSHHCYFSMNDTTDVTTAAAICEANLAHVVRFVSEKEV